MNRPDGINYRGSDWRAICNALHEQIKSIDVINRSMEIDWQATQNNRALQQAMQTIIDWDRVSEPAQQVPVYAIRQDEFGPGAQYDPTRPHPDDEPV